MKYALTSREIDLIVDGLDASVRENTRLGSDADRLGYRTQAREFYAKAAEAQTLATTAKSVSIEKITVRY